MRSIWKFPMGVTDKVVVEMPIGAVPVHVDVQHGQPCLWASVDPAAKTEMREFRLLGTGQELEDKEFDRLGYIDTFMQMEEQSAWHLFGVTEAQCGVGAKVERTPWSFDIAEVANHLDWEVDKWPANCYGVACAIHDNPKVDVGAAVPVFGRWEGPVSEDCVIEGWHERHKMVSLQHGWLEKPDGTVIDPTRWVFEAVKPYIYVGPADHYDPGGNNLRKKHRNPVPDHDQDNPSPASKYLKARVLDSVCQLLGTAEKIVPSAPQMFWIANLSPEEIYPYAAEIYEALEKGGLRALVPLDNWIRIMGPAG